MGKNVIYHSALTDPLEIDGTLDFYQDGNSIVFRHDLSNGPPPLYGAEAIYSEPAWRQGYVKFMTRAGLTVNDATVEYNRYLQAIRNTVESSGLPAYVLLGKHMLKRLEPETAHPCRLHGYDALLGLWNAQDDIGLCDIVTNNDALAYIAKRYSVVADFCCGYGNLARVMSILDKDFVCSDVNGHCVYYVAKYIMGYRG